MTMEKVGVSNEVLHTGLRNEEANLMQRIQHLNANKEKTAAANELPQVEQRLQDVRNRLTELDTKGD